MSYSYIYNYFAVPEEYGTTRKSHILRPHTSDSLCAGWDLDKDDNYKLADSLRQDRRLCVSCLDSLQTTMSSRGTDAVALQVFEVLVDRLRTLEASVEQ